MLQAMLRKQCTQAMPIRTYGTYGLRKWLSTREILTFRNARARIPKLSRVEASAS